MWRRRFSRLPPKPDSIFWREGGRELPLPSSPVVAHDLPGWGEIRLSPVRWGNEPGRDPDGICWSRERVTSRKVKLS